MTKNKVFFAAAVLLSSLLTSVNVNAQERGGHGGGGRGGERGERSGPPPKGDFNAPPNDDRSFEQTETLEEIGRYKIGDVATDFELKNVDGEMFSLSDIEGAKGYIIVFTCNECPYAKMYEDRLIALHKEYAPKGYSVIAINANYSDTNENENFAAMQKRAEEKEFPFVYLADEGQTIFPQYGAVRTPHVFLLDNERKLRYIGAIDDNPKSVSGVQAKYLEYAIISLEKNRKPFPNFTNAIGCPVEVY